MFNLYSYESVNGEGDKLIFVTPLKQLVSVGIPNTENSSF